MSFLKRLFGGSKKQNPPIQTQAQRQAPAVAPPPPPKPILATPAAARPLSQQPQNAEVEKIRQEALAILRSPGSSVADIFENVYGLAKPAQTSPTPQAVESQELQKSGKAEVNEPHTMLMNGIFWAKTGEVRFEGVNRSLVTILRFYDKNTVGINTFAENAIAQDTVNKLDRFLRSDCNFLGEYRINGDQLQFNVTNENSPVMKESQGFQTCKALGTIKSPKQILLKLSYPQMNGPYRDFNKDGECTFEFHAISFSKMDA